MTTSIPLRMHNRIPYFISNVNTGSFRKRGVELYGMDAAPLWEPAIMAASLKGERVDEAEWYRAAYSF